MSKSGCFGPGKLTIDVRGGNGGIGQNGGNGENGQKGYDAKDQKEVQNRNKNFLVRRVPYKWDDKEGLEKVNQVWKTIGTFNGQML